MQSTPQPAFALRRIAAVLVGLEALALAAGAVVLVGGALTDESATDMAVAIALVALVFAVALALACHALWRGRPWPRGLVITWQVLQVAAGVTVLDWSVAAGAAAIVIAVLCGGAVVADARRDLPDAPA